jgi:transposase
MRCDEESGTASASAQGRARTRSRPFRAVYRSLTACGRCALRIAQAIGLRSDQESGMKTSCGHLRKLADRQIREVLKWHREAVEFRRRHGTVEELATLLGVSLHAVRGCFESRNPDTLEEDGVQASHSPGRRGRPRRLNPAQIAFVLAWRNASRHFSAQHGTVASLARKLGVGASTIHDCVRRKGRYQQRADADATQVRGSRRAYLPTSKNARIAALFRAWPRR